MNEPAAITAMMDKAESKLKTAHIDFASGQAENNIHDAEIIVKTIKSQILV